MPKSKRRKHGRGGFSSPRHAYVPKRYYRTRRCGRRNLNDFTRSGQGGPNYSSRDVTGPSKELATTANSQSSERKCQEFTYHMAHYGFPSDERNNVPTDHHSSLHYGSTDVVDCSEKHHNRQKQSKTHRVGNCIESNPQFRSKADILGVSFYDKMNFVSGNYSNHECGNGDALYSSETPLSYRVSSETMKTGQYANSNENNYRLGFQMDRHDFPFSDKKNHALDHQNHLFCEQDHNAQLMQKRTDASENNFRDWISSILSCLVKNGNRMELEQLQRVVHNEHATQYSNIEMEIETFPNIFDISESISDTETDGNEEEGIIRDKYVSGKTDVRLCEHHCSNAGSCSSKDCNGLHICKFYILNTCCFEQCVFGHDIRDPHNVQVLKMHLLHALSPEDLGYLMRNIRNRNETTMPTICRFYNKLTGCSRNDCQFLHLCKWFVKGDCKFDEKCQRSHNYLDQQPSLVLRRYGIIEEKDMEVVKIFLRDAGSTKENKSNTLVASGTKYLGFSRLNRFVKYDQGHTGEVKERRLSKSSIMDVNKLEESVSVKNLDSMSDQIATGEICTEIEDGECDSEPPSPNWIKHCLPIPSCNGKLEGKGLTQFCVDTNEIDAAGDRNLGAVFEEDLKHECLDQRDPSQHVEKPCFSDCLLTATTNKRDSLNNGCSGTECVQAMSPTVIENCDTAIPVDDNVLGRSEQMLLVTMAQNHANSSPPIPSCNGKLEGKGLTQFCVDTNEIDAAGDRSLETVFEGDLKHECLDQRDPSQQVEKPCFSDSLLNATTNKRDNFNNGYSGTECVQAMSPAVIENCYTANSSPPDDARNLELKRVIAKDGMPTWIYRCIENMTSLPLEPDICDHLEKRFQQFQRARKCSIEILGLKLDVDLLTVEEAPLILPVQATHELQ